MLGGVLASLHNLRFIIALVDGARQAIIDGRFAEYKDDFLKKYKGL
jgi:queuine tRNA-ribosyltransferase